MRRLVRSFAKLLFHAILRVRIPLPAATRIFIRDATRKFFHRSPFFPHDSRLRPAPLALRVIHECVVGNCPADFEIYGGRLQFRSTGSQMSMHGYYVGEFEHHLVRFIVDRLRDDSIVLDIGGHHGEFAVPIAYEIRERRLSSKVWSFEPDPDNFALLRYNLARNGLSAFAELHMVAVADHAYHAAELLCPADNSSNTLAANGVFAIGDELSTARRRVVETVCLDDLDYGSSRIGLVKLDIQGGEPDALAGATTTLERHRPVLVLEVVATWPRAREVERILHELGYTIHGLSRSGALVPLDDPRVFVSWDWIALPGR